MSESPNSPPGSAPTPPAASSIEAAATTAAALMPPMRPRNVSSTLWPWLLLLLAIAVAGASYWYLFDRLQRVQTESVEHARVSNQEIEKLNEALNRAHAETKNLQEDLMQVKEQRVAIEQLYSDLVRGRDESALFDIERLIVIAAQELRLTGHVPTAIAALESADARLARLGRPQYLGLRKVLARDLEQLRVAAQFDVAGIALKLDQLASGIDSWPLLADASAKPKAAAVAAPAEPAGRWQRVRQWFADEFGELVRVREVETPDALLLNSAQQNFVRERVRLRLLDARQAVLARNDRLLRAEVSEVRGLLDRYFDGKNPAVMQATNQLKMLSQASLTIELPSLDDALAATRSARTAPPTR